MVGIINCIRLSTCENKTLMKDLYHACCIVGVVRDNRMIVDSNVLMRRVINASEDPGSMLLAIATKNYSNQYPYTMIVNDL